MIDVETARRLNNYDTDALIRLLELNEDRLYAWLFLDSVTVVRDGPDRSIEYDKTQRKMVRSELPEYVSPFEAVLPI
jgi:hypothetical protein